MLIPLEGENVKPLSSSRPFCPAPPKRDGSKVQFKPIDVMGSWKYNVRQGGGTMYWRTKTNAPVPQGPAAGRPGRAVGPAETVEVMVREFPSVADDPTIEEPLRSGAGGIAIRRLDRPVAYLLYYPWYWPRNLGATTEHRGMRSWATRPSRSFRKGIPSTVP